MPWYYAGPEAKPVGPVSLEELHAGCVNGTITPDTYIIEPTGRPEAPGEWRRYRDVFPVSGAWPPLPPIPPAISPPPPPPGTSPHPLFPSATHAPTAPATPLAAAPHAHYPVRKTNSWCAWGFGLGLAGFFLSFVCFGFLLAIPALIISILGYAQVQKNRAEAGRGLAIAGGVLAVLALLISLGILACAVPAIIKNHEWTVTEQSSTNAQ